MNRIWISGLAGVVMGLGLMLSGMARPEVVLGFLDPLGAWNPALGFVMGGAIPVAAVGFAIANRRGRALCDPKLHFPANRRIDFRLILGAVIFGVGWGIAGVCPAPAFTLAPRAPLAALAFLLPMVVGLLLAPKLRWTPPGAATPASGGSLGAAAPGH